ncbi:type II toxin-antitoxin system RelE/ParE family toxin [Aquibium sp. ELW1220]|uniref:type II toxin-antitoxin system RelE/ParE family toxin n=1 Tax=Aquibium sp. ELW1220 TaxID=2976766 RepID=UPI0025AFC79D|nr:type II toxin-antitoxin system RelE/ParE family toxin [Aquibium sp. ELW1220]MDN2579524.1 type II toxin-antitoxin system RelE/ParE family toxin [Aquibium sp. ELW1220]
MKRRQVSLSRDARIDLAEIYDLIADASGPSIAIGYIDRLKRCCLGFERAAMRGSARDDILPGLRIVGFERRVTIAFLVRDQDVVILRLFYGGRDWETQLR